MEDMIYKRVGRIVVRPNKDGTDDNLILGSSFDAGVFKPGFVYEILEFLGEIVIREVGESSTKYSFNEKPIGGSVWCHDANTIIKNGTHLLTEKEYRENVHDSRNEEEKINDNRKEVLGDILDDNNKFKRNFL